ncbi:MAG TPA: hypothetical protein VIV55_06615 [Flavobacterium sp.]
MNTKEIKREKIHMSFQGEAYNNVREEASEKIKPLNNAIKELETIIKKPISDYEAFSKDLLGYALKEIKITYPKPFELELGDEATLKMLLIDLTSLKECAKKWDINTKHTIEEGYAHIAIDIEKFNQYAETKEQFERYDFAMQCVDTIEKATSYVKWLRPQDLADHYKFFVQSHFTQDGKVKVSVRPEFVLTGN